MRRCLSRTVRKPHFAAGTVSALRHGTNRPFTAGVPLPVGKEEPGSQNVVADFGDVMSHLSGAVTDASHTSGSTHPLMDRHISGQRYEAGQQETPTVRPMRSKKRAKVFTQGLHVDAPELDASSPAASNAPQLSSGESPRRGHHQQRRGKQSHYGEGKDKYAERKRGAEFLRQQKATAVGGATVGAQRAGRRLSAADREQYLGSVQTAQDRLDAVTKLQMADEKPDEYGARLLVQEGKMPAEEAAKLALEPDEEDGELDGDVEGHYARLQGLRMKRPPPFMNDMLKERLLELKAINAADERTSTHLPRRRDPHHHDDRADEHPAMQKQKNHGAKKKRSETALFDESDPQFMVNAAMASDDLLTAYDPVRRSGASSVEAPLQQSIPAESASVTNALAAHTAGATDAAAHRDSDAVAGQQKEPLLPHTSDPSDVDKGPTLHRALQRAGLCSRRAAVEHITAGRVKVGAEIVRDPFRHVTASDDIFMEGHRGRLRFAAPRLWLFHKPANVLVGGKDDQGRTLWKKYAEISGFSHLMPVGSMPYRSHGLLLLTNDGDLARYMEHPGSKLQSSYVFRVKPPIDAVLAHKLTTEGVIVSGRRHRGYTFTAMEKRKNMIKVKVQPGKDNAKAEIPVSQLLQHLGRRIIRGGRVSIGQYQLGPLAPGTMKEVSIPPTYEMVSSKIWQPFIERDWPFYRRRRVEKLKKVAQWRSLSDKEREELDAFTVAGLQQALSFESAEISAEAAEAAELMQHPPRITDTDPAAFDLPPADADEPTVQF